MTPTKNTSLGKFILSFGFIFISAIYAAWQNTNTQQARITPAQEFQDANNAFLKTLTQTNSNAPTPTTSSAPQKPKTLGQYTDGSYTGTPADAYYGTVQIQAVITNGAIADVQFLQYPSDRDTSRYINGQAIPLLFREAIQAQSSQVDGVSGATFTSQAFKKSLASALAQAKR